MTKTVKVDTKITEQSFSICLAKIFDLENRITAFEWAVTPVLEETRKYGDTHDTTTEFNLVYRTLYKLRNDAYRNLFMLAVMTSTDPKYVSEAKKLAFDRFIGEHKNISYLFGNKIPGSGDSEIEAKFKKELDWWKSREYNNTKKSNKNIKRVLSGKQAKTKP